MTMLASTRDAVAARRRVSAIARLLVLGIVFFTSQGIAHASVIGSMHSRVDLKADEAGADFIDYADFIGIADSFSGLRYASPFASLTSDPSNPTSFILTLNDIGKTFISRPGDGVASSGGTFGPGGFDLAVELLTNGVDNLWFFAAVSGGLAFSESRLADGCPLFCSTYPTTVQGWNTFNGIDFAGYEITAISLTIHDLVIGPKIPGQYTPFTIDRTLTIHGHPIAEPTALALFAAGLAATGFLGWLSKRRRNPQRSAISAS